MQQLEQLRNVNLDRITLDESVALLAFGASLKTAYAENKLPEPEWLGDSLKVLKADVASKRTDALRKALKEATARREGLKTAEEKRNHTDAEIARLQAELGEAPTS